MKSQVVPILEGEPARLEVIGMTVGYRERVILEDISFQVPHGARVAVVGPNGAGKSTLFKALVGLLPLLRGQVKIHGQPLGQHQDCVAYVPQREDIDWGFPVNVRDVVLMGRTRRFRGLRRPGARDWEVVYRSLEQLGIADLAERPISDLSGGQQQRVFIARALAQEPHILLMDEPFSGVDISTQEATLKLLDDLHDQGVTAMVSTHDLEMAARRFEKVMLLNKKVITFGAAQEVFTEDALRVAFGGQLLLMGNGRSVVVDQCCSHDEENETEHVHGGSAR